jgi:RNA polymerase sigma-70 factor (ECF subfamily)
VKSDFKNLTAEQLALRAQQGCNNSFCELVERFSIRLVRFLQRETANAQNAEDIAQETFVRAWQNISRYKPRWRFSTWLYTIGYRLACNYHADLPIDSAAMSRRPDAQPPDVLAENRETGLKLWSIAAQLPQNQYEALWLKYAEDMSIKEIAKVTGKSRVNVKVTLYRARTGLAKRLKPGIAKTAAYADNNNTLLFGKAEESKCGASFTDL